MKRAIIDAYVDEETRKMLVSDAAQKSAQNLEIGDRCLIYFPQTQQSKLYSNWKGVYVIQERIDRNSFIVAESEQLRKKYLVDRSRIRILDTTLQQETALGPGEQGNNELEPETFQEKEQQTSSQLIEGKGEHSFNTRNNSEKALVSQNNLTECSPVKDTQTTSPLHSRPKRLARHKANAKIRGWTKALRKTKK